MSTDAGDLGIVNHHIIRALQALTGLDRLAVVRRRAELLAQMLTVQRELSRLEREVGREIDKAKGDKT